MGGECAMTAKLAVTTDLALKCADFIDRLCQQIDYKPVAELRLGHAVVLELLELQREMRVYEWKAS
jgi:hypothetical protein